MERHGEAQGCTEKVERCREAQRQEWAVPHPHVVDKNWEGHLRNKGSQPQSKPSSPEFLGQKDKSL